MTLPDSKRRHGLIAATHPPFHADGPLHPAIVEKQAAHRTTAQHALHSRAASHGYMGAAQTVLGLLGVNVGLARLLNDSLDAAQAGKLEEDLNTPGFLERVRPA